MSNHLPETNDFSIASKLSMVTKGYFEDNFMKYLSPKFKRRSPLINIGYCVRAVVVNEGINIFLRTVADLDSQIVSLGAGFDTTFFRLISKHENINYFEVDFTEVVKNKMNVIKNTQILHNQLIDSKECSIGLWSKRYKLIAQDMSNIQELRKAMLDAGLNINKPTLFLSECAITYMEEDTSRNIIEWGSSFKDVIFLIYEQISPFDGFGQVMMNHFMSIDSPLKSLEKIHSKIDQIKRFELCGYDYAWSVGASEIFKNVLTISEQERIINLEPFDEWEEWHLTSNHYTLSAGIKGIFESPSSDFASIFDSNRSFQEPAFSCSWDLVENVDLQFYGHTALLIWNSTACLVIGGFGLDNNEKHRRLTRFCLITLPNMKVTYIEPPTVDDVIWDCLYHSCSLISDDINTSVVLLFGGRTSPLRTVNRSPAVITLTRENEDVITSVEKVDQNKTDFPQPRRRHTASLINGKTFIFGGIYSDPEQSRQKILGDAWLLTKDGMWIKQESKPPPRFSHSASIYSDKVFIIGGISCSFESLSDIWIYSIKDHIWTEVSINIIPRYCHTSHIFKNTLLLVGGVNEFSEKQPGLTTINLSNMAFTEYKLPESTKNFPVMLHNHTSFIYSNNLYVIGGGGNCFSFGTSFNKCSIKFNLESLII